MAKDLFDEFGIDPKSAAPKKDLFDEFGVNPPKPEEPGLLDRGVQGFKDTLTYGRLNQSSDPAEQAGLIAGMVDRRLPQTPAAQEMQRNLAPKIQEAKDATGVVDNVAKWGSLAGSMAKEFASNPKEFAGMMVENLPNSAPGMAGMLLGGVAGAQAGPFAPVTVPAGAALGGFGGGYLIEQGSTFADVVLKEAQAKGIDPRNKEALAGLITDNYDKFLEQSRLKGAATAGVDTAINMLTMGAAGAFERPLVKAAQGIEKGVAGGTLTAAEGAAQLAALEAKNAARNTPGAKLLRGAGITAAEMGGESLSEAAGQQLAFGELDPYDVLAEGMLAVGQGAGMAAGRKVISPIIGTTQRDGVDDSLNRARQAIDARDITGADQANADLGFAAGQYADLIPSEQRLLGSQPSVITVPTQDGGTTTIDRNTGPLSDIAVDVIQGQIQTGMPLRAYASPLEAQAALEQRPDSERMRVATHPRVDDSYAIVPKTAEALAAMDRKAEAKAKSEERLATVESEDGNASQVATTGGQGSGTVAGGSAGDSPSVGASAPGRGTDTSLGDASVGDAALDELAPAPVQPVSSMPAAERVKAERQAAARAEAQARGAQLTDDEVASANTEPTEAQQAAGNYQKGHVKIGSLDISIENPAGSIRSGKEGNKSWSVQMSDHYGYIKRTEGADGEQVDVYVKAGTATDHNGPVFVVDQYNPKTGQFDEHKAFVGYRTALDVTRAYDAHFSDGTGPKRRKGITKMAPDAFTAWARHGDTSQAADKAQAEIAQSTGKESKKRSNGDLYQAAADANKRKQERRLPTEQNDTLAVREATGAEVSVVSEKDLPEADAAPAGHVSRQTAEFARHVAKLFGKRVVFVEGMPADGFYNHGNTIYLSTTGSVHHLRLLGHEMLHALRSQSKETYAKLLEAVRDVVTDAQLKSQFRDYFSQDKGKKDWTDDQITEWLADDKNRDFLTEEWMADLSGNRWTESGFWEDVFTQVENKYGSEQAKGIIAKLRLALVTALNKLKTLVRGSAFAVDGRVAEHLDQIRAALATGFADYAKAVKDKQTTEGTGDVKFAKSPGSDIGHKRNSDGRYVGSPDWVGASTSQVTLLRKKLHGLAIEGEPGRMWYERSSEAILELVNGNKAEAEKIVQLIAIYSPSNAVPGNTTMAIKAYYQWKQGLPIRVGTTNNDKKANDLLYQGKEWSGIKTNSFYQNLMQEIDPSKNDTGKATMDMWMALAFDYGMKTVDQGPKYGFMEREIQRLARELGWTPHQVQAAIWTAMKGRIDPIRGELTAAELDLGWHNAEATAEWKNGAREEYMARRKKYLLDRAAGKKVSPPEIKLAGIDTLNADRKKDHYKLAHKMGMEYDLRKSDIEESKYDFSDAIKQRTAQMSWEATPGKSTMVLPGIHDAPMWQQMEYLAAMQKAFSDADGNDIIGKEVGLAMAESVQGFSGWQGASSIGIQDGIVVPPNSQEGGLVQGVARDAINLVADIRGLVLNQEGVAWHYPIYTGSKNALNGIDFNIGRLLTEAENANLYQALIDELGHAFSPPIPSQDGQGFRVLNFPDEKFALMGEFDGSVDLLGLDGKHRKTALQKSQLAKNEAFYNAARKAVAKQSWVMDVTQERRFETDGELRENDWSNGDSDYRGRIAEAVAAPGQRKPRSWAGRSDIFEWIDNDLRPKADAVNRQFAQKYGWAKQGEFKFSTRRSDAPGNGRDGSSDARTGEEVRGYGTAAPGAVTVQGTHYSQQERASLDGRYYGTGMRGAEGPRVRAATDPRLKERVYFYVDKGTGIRPEDGVGSIAHTAQLNNIYDANADTWIQQKVGRELSGDAWLNAFESSVIDNGFDGYVTDFGTQRAAVLLGRHNVPVTRGKGGVSEAKQAAVTAKRTDLPMGKMTGAEWKKLEPRATELEDDKSYYRDQVRFSPSRFDAIAEAFADRARKALANPRNTQPVLIHSNTPASMQILGWADRKLIVEASELAKIASKPGFETDEKIGNLVLDLARPGAMFWNEKQGSLNILRREDMRGAPALIAVRPGVPMGIDRAHLMVTAHRLENQGALLRKITSGELKPLYLDQANPLIKQAMQTRKYRVSTLDLLAPENLHARASVQLDTSSRLLSEADLVKWEQDNWGDAPKFSPARLTEDRIDRLMSQYAYTMDDKKSKAYIAWVRPESYLAATTIPGRERAQLESEKRPLDKDGLRNEYQEIFLLGKFDPENGWWKTTGHEGRHRMMALRDAGITRVPVVFGAHEGERREPIGNLFVTPQRWGNAKAERGFFAANLIPINYDNLGKIKTEFGGDADVKFSPSRAQTETPEFKKWYEGSNLRNADGSPMVLYHGTNKDFSRFGISKTGAMGPGVYLGDDPEVANAYSDGTGANVMPVYARGRYIGNREWSSYVSDYGWKKGREKAIEDGVAGVWDQKFESAVLVFDPANIKSAIGNNGQFDPTNPDIRYSPSRWYFSPLQRAFEQAPDRVFSTAPQIKAWLLSNAGKLGVKQDEIVWSGITDWLDLQGKQKVGKGQVLQYLSENGVQIEEVEKGKTGYNEDDPALPEGRDLKVIEADEEYHGRLASRYKYVVIDEASDTTKGWGNSEAEAIADAHSGHPEYWEGKDSTHYGKYVLPGGKNYRELLLTLPEAKRPTVDSIARELFGTGYNNLDSQSQQTARDKAKEYDSRNYSSPHWGEKNILAHVRMNDRTDADGNRVLFIEELQSDWGQEGKKKGFGTKPQEHVPAAPFVTDTKAWTGLAVKRMVVYAAENGYDKVAFVNGEQSAERYDLSKQVESIGYDPKVKRLEAYDKNRSQVIDKTVSEDQLEDYIGKEVAKRLLEQPLVMGKHLLDGEEIKVGGEGMKAFYDKIVPQVVSDVLKKVGGGKLESVRVGVGSVAKTSDRLGFDTSEIQFKRDAAGNWGVEKNPDTVVGGKRLYWDGSSFVEDEGSARVFGSKEEATASVTASRQTGFSITPAMREQVGRGLPLFSLARKVSDAVDSTLGKLDAAVDGLSNLPDQFDYLRDRYLALGKIARVDEISTEVRKAFDGAAPADKQAVYDYLTTRGATTGRISDHKLRSIAKRIKDTINYTGDQLVARGLLDQEARDHYRDQYLPRMYLRHMLDDQAFKVIGMGKKPSDMGYLKHRKDIPQEIRDVVLGEIKDPSFLSVNAIGRAMRDVSLLDWMGKISQNNDWVFPEIFVPWQGKKVTAYWLRAEADRIENQSAHYTPANKAKADALVAQMRSTAHQALGSMSAIDHKKFKQIPDTRRYGLLRGMWVRTEIYNDIMGASQIVNADPTWFEDWFGFGGKGTRLTQWWKFTKVAANPPGQIRNFISNMVMLQLSGIGLHRLPFALIEAARDITNNGKYWQVAKKYGVTESTFTAQELFRVKRDLVEMEAQKGKLSSLRWLMSAGARFFEGVSDLYQFSEALGKTIKIMEEMKAGKSEAEAAIEAQKWLFDYSLVPQSVRIARNAPVGMPFLTYQVKVLPRLLEVAAKHPWRFLPWAGLLYGMQAAVASMFGVDDDELKKLKKSLPEWLQDRGHTVFLPFRDADGRLQVADVGYFFPWTFYSQTGKHVADGKVKKALVDDVGGQFSAPILGAAAALMANYDTFTKQPIYKETDPVGYQAAAIANYAYDLMAPPFISSHGVVSPMGLVDTKFGGKLTQALAGTTNRFGDPKATEEQALGAMLGFNFYGMDPEHTRVTNLKVMEFKVHEAEKGLKQRLMDKGLSSEQRLEAIRDYRERMSELQQEMLEYAKESQVPEQLKAKKR